MRTPKQTPKSVKEEFEWTDLARDSKRLGRGFTEYDRQLIKPIDTIDVSVKMVHTETENAA